MSPTWDLLRGNHPQRPQPALFLRVGKARAAFGGFGARRLALIGRCVLVVLLLFWRVVPLQDSSGRSDPLGRQDEGADGGELVTLMFPICELSSSSGPFHTAGPTNRSPLSLSRHFDDLLAFHRG